MTKWQQGVAAILAAGWIVWVSSTLWDLNVKVTRIETIVVPPRVSDGAHPHRLASIP